MGGVNPAYEYVKASLEKGKSVCTSNKELVAKHGAELLAIAKEKNVNFLFEASVGGGIPIIRPLNQSLTADEIRNAIIAEDINKIKSIKGIGLKSAQRLILELKDKVVKGAGSETTQLFSSGSNPAVEEATTALVLLGFTKANVNKAVSAVLKESPEASLEEIIKLSLKRL